MNKYNYNNIKIILSILGLLIENNAFGSGPYQTNSYTPIPYASYDTIQLYPLLADTQCINSKDGTLYSFDDIVYFCQGGLPKKLGAGGIWTKDNLNHIYPTDTLLDTKIKIGIGTKTPSFKLTLDSSGVGGGILATGTYNPTAASLASLTSSGPGAKFIWYAKKAAFRAGGTEGVGSSYWDDANIGGYSFAFGNSNKASKEFSAALGGMNNSVESTNSTILGGNNNKIIPFTPANSESNIIAAGLNNNISGNKFNFIGGGKTNNITQLLAGPISFNTILGGEANAITDSSNALIGGGFTNRIKTLCDNTIITGGNYNNINADSAFSNILGGKSNDIFGKYSVVAGGLGDAADAEIVGDYNVILGGTSNKLKNFYLYRSIIGGANNKAYGNYSTVGGGELNTAGKSTIPAGTDAFASVFGGKNNKATENYSLIIGGENNQATNIYSFVAGGKNNQATGQYSSVLGGFNNTAEGLHSIVLNGTNNHARGDYSWAGGSNTTIAPTGYNTFAWNTLGAINVTVPNAFIINSDFVGINTSNPSSTQRLHIVGNVKINNGTIIIESLPSLNSSNLNINTTSKNIGNDLAEVFETSEDVEPGDLLVMDPKDPSKLRKSQIAIDATVIGVVSDAPAIFFEGNQMQVSPKPFTFTKGTKPPVALSGRVLCKVSLENGSIQPGDLLTTSSTTGHAMKATDQDKSFGAIIGRALESFDDTNINQTGKIIILVTRR